MNTLFFLCGMGSGALIATLLMLAVMIFMTRNAKKTQKVNDALIELHTERNRIFEGIHDAILR